MFYFLMLVVLLAGCEKFGGSGREIRFSAISSPGQVTKTAYTGVIPSGSTERIDWKDGDVIRVYSPEAACNNDDTYHWADYNLSGIAAGTGSEAILSKGKMNVKSDDNTRGGLAWTENAGPYTFYGIYPAPSAAEAPGTVLGNASGTAFPCTIPAAQMGTAVNVVEFNAVTDPLTPPRIDVYYPPMSNAYMVAQTSASKGTTLATLKFEPAYTAFHIRAGAPSGEPDKVIKSVALTSTSTALAGAYGAYYDSSTSKWVYSITGTDNAISFQFNTDTDDDPENYTIAAEDAVEFVLFALPQTLTDLTIVFTMGDNTHRSLELKKNTPDGTTNEAGFIKFAPCKKHYISGLVVPNSVWTVDNTTPVILRETAAKPWDDNQQDMNYGTDLVVNASGLDEVNLSTHSYRFSIYEPHGETWKIRVLNGSGTVVSGVKIVRDNPDPASGNGELTGLIRGGSATGSGLVEFHLEKADPSAPNATGGENCTLSFSVVAGGTEYSINSEVVRGSWGTGYSYINF